MDLVALSTFVNFIRIMHAIDARHFKYVQRHRFQWHLGIKQHTNDRSQCCLLNDIRDVKFKVLHSLITSHSAKSAQQNTFEMNFRLTSHFYFHIERVQLNKNPRESQPHIQWEETRKKLDTFLYTKNFLSELYFIGLYRILTIFLFLFSCGSSFFNFSAVEWREQQKCLQQQKEYYLLIK